MDSASRELLSRLLDGDLDQPESKLLSRRLAADPDLAAELDAMRRLRRAVSDLREGMAPPEDLDRLMEPLRRGAPVSRSPTWLRGLAAAAAIILGITVLVEVNRLGRDPNGSSIHKLRQKSPTDSTPRHGIYRLRPLPTSSVPEDEIPLGVADRLIASPVPEPVLDEPSPVYFVGPLSESPSAGGAAPDGPSTPPPEAAGYGIRATLAIGPEDWRLSWPAGATDDIPAGRYPIRIDVKDDRVTGVDAENLDGEVLTAIQSVIVGITVSGLEGGRYVAVLMVVRL